MGRSLRGAVVAALLLGPGPLAAQEAALPQAPEDSPRPEARPDPEDRAEGMGGVAEATEADPGADSQPDAGAEETAASDEPADVADGAAEDAAGETPDTADASEPQEAQEGDVEDQAEPGAVEGAASDAPPEPPAPPAWEELAEPPGELAACLARLDAHGTAYTRTDPPEDPAIRDCGIANPIAVTEILPGIALNPDSVMRCAAALALADWIATEVRPAAALLDRGEVAAVEHGSTYICRMRGGGAKVSEHGFGNAVDVMGFRFEDGSRVAIEPRADAGTLLEAFQRAARGGACLHFTTVLGPGTDAAHADHLHLDVKQRSGGYRICQ